MNTKEIDAIVRPFTTEEAKSKVGKYIIKRPGVFAEDDGSVYKIIDVQADGFTFWEKDFYWNSYKFDNIIYDYLFEDGTFIGVYK
jgi:hypothetical protein